MVISTSRLATWVKGLRCCEMMVGTAETDTAVGYLSASDKRLIAGLGGDPIAKLVEIRWPSGVVQRFENVKAGQMLKATEPTP